MRHQPIPNGYSTVSPYLVCDNAHAVLEFIRKTFGVEHRGILHLPTGKIAHTEVKLGDTVIMLTDANDNFKNSGGSIIHVYVEDCDDTYARALAAGGTSVQELQTFFYGDRSGGVKDSSGNTWWISSRVENPSKEETQRRLDELTKQNATP